MSRARPLQIIVCAAMRHQPTGLIVCGARHFDSLMRPIIERLGLDFIHWDQGFVDQYGTFIDREEAWRIADMRGQIRRPTGNELNLDTPRLPAVGDEGRLFSENLY